MRKATKFYFDTKLLFLNENKCCSTWFVTVVLNLVSLKIFDFDENDVI